MSSMSIATVPDTTHNSARLDFEEIFRERSPMIYRAAYAITGSCEDADDVLQTVFLKLIRREYPPDLKTNPKAYLHRAAVNMSLDVIRNRRRYTAAEGFEHLEAPASIEDELPTRLNGLLARLEPEAAH